MKQKLAIACGLLHSPQVMIFDEPLTGLDPLGIRRMKDSILRRARAGAAIVLSSHLLHLLEEVCSHVLILKNGEKIADGTIAAGARAVQRRRRRREPRGCVHPRHRRHGALSARAMLGALLYLQLTSLARPAALATAAAEAAEVSLIGALVGVGYCTSSSCARGAARAAGGHAETCRFRRMRLPLFASVGALALLLVVALSWMLPRSAGGPRIQRSRDRVPVSGADPAAAR